MKKKIRFLLNVHIIYFYLSNKILIFEKKGFKSGGLKYLYIIFQKKKKKKNNNRKLKN